VTTSAAKEINSEINSSHSNEFSENLTSILCHLTCQISRNLLAGRPPRKSTAIIANDDWSG